MLESTVRLAAADMLLATGAQKGEMTPFIVVKKWEQDASGSWRRTSRLVFDERLAKHRWRALPWCSLGADASRGRIDAYDYAEQGSETGSGRHPRLPLQAAPPRRDGVALRFDGCRSQAGRHIDGCRSQAGRHGHEGAGLQGAFRQEPPVLGCAGSRDGIPVELSTLPSPG